MCVICVVWRVYWFPSELAGTYFISAIKYVQRTMLVLQANMTLAYFYNKMSWLKLSCI